MFFGQTVNVWEQLLKGKLSQLPGYFHSKEVEYVYSVTKTKLSVYFNSVEVFQSNANFVNLHSFFKVLQECKTKLGVDRQQQIEVEFLLKSDCFNFSTNYYLSSEDDSFRKFYANVQNRLSKFKKLRTNFGTDRQSGMVAELKSTVGVRDTSIQSDSSQHKLNTIPAIVSEPSQNNSNYWDDIEDEWQKLDYLRKPQITNPILNQRLQDSVQATKPDQELPVTGFMETLFSSDLTGVEVLASDNVIKHQYPNVLSSHFNAARSLSILSNKDSFNTFSQVKVLSALEVQAEPSLKNNLNLLHEIISDPALAGDQSEAVNLDYLNPEVQREINLAKAPVLVKERQVQASSSSIEEVEADYTSVALFLNSSSSNSSIANFRNNSFAGFSSPALNATGISTLEVSAEASELKESGELTRLEVLKQSVAISRENFAAQSVSIANTATMITTNETNSLEEVAESALKQARAALIQPKLSEKSRTDLAAKVIANEQAIVSVTKPTRASRPLKDNKGSESLSEGQIKEFETSLDLLFAKIKASSLAKIEQNQGRLTASAKITTRKKIFTTTKITEAETASKFVESSMQLDLRNYKVGTANYYAYDLLVRKLKNSFVEVKTNKTEFDFKSYFIAGQAGVGKTALVQELIANLTSVSKLNKLNLNCKYIEDFNSEYFAAAKAQKVADFGNSLLESDLLVIDDCQALRESSLKYLALLQKRFARRKNKALILLSSDSKAKLVAKFENKEVQDSLNHCLGLELKLPDLLLRKQIVSHSLKVKFGMTNLKESRLQEIVNFTKSLDLRLTLKLVEDFVNSKLSFAEFVKRHAATDLCDAKFSRSQLEQAIFQEYGISEQDLKTKSRRKLLVQLREVFVYLWYVNQQPKYVEIADYLMMSSSNVKRILTKTRKYVTQNDEDFMNKISAIKQQII